MISFKRKLRICHRQVARLEFLGSLADRLTEPHERVSEPVRVEIGQAGVRERCAKDASGAGGVEGAVG